MGEAKGVETGELEHHLSTGYHPRDLLKRFTCSNQNQSSAVKTEETEEIELNLGLSLGGRFGVDPKESNKLVRSTSIAGLSTLSRDADVAASMAAAATSAQQVMCTSIFRTTSLPTETEEEWRKRKEMQCFRRMEAKRKRSEKQKNIRNGGSSGSRDRASLEGNSEEKRLDVGAPLSAKQQHQQQFVPSGLPSWANRASLVGCQNGKPNAAFASQGFPPPSSQGSVGSQGSISSGISEFDSRPAQGLSNCAEARSPVSVQSLPDQSDQKPNISPTSDTKVEVGMPTKVEEEKATKKPKLMENGAGETGMKVMEDMPCVSTKGDGPNGRKIEGFLYRYKKGEEVRIVCVCHGKFLTPAEFVKHAGGGDVTHPLRHIVVNPSTSLA